MIAEGWAREGRLGTRDGIQRWILWPWQGRRHGTSGEGRMERGTVLRIEGRKHHGLAPNSMKQRKARVEEHSEGHEHGHQ